VKFPILENQQAIRFGHASRGKNDSRINSEIRNSLSRKRITVSLQYKAKLTETEKKKKGFS
jgi:hypothetical protein